jgi:hypothetical protein
MKNFENRKNSVSCQGYRSITETKYSLPLKGCLVENMYRPENIQTWLKR